MFTYYVFVWILILLCIIIKIRELAWVMQLYIANFISIHPMEYFQKVHITASFLLAESKSVRTSNISYLTDVSCFFFRLSSI